MKRLIAWLVMAMATLTVNAQQNLYRAERDELDLQGKAIINEYRRLTQTDPKIEKAATKARMVQLADQLDSLADQQLKLIRKIIRTNKNNQIPVRYIVDATFLLGYEGLKEALDPTAAYYNDPRLNMAKYVLECYKKRLPGMQYHELTLKDLQDKDVRLSQWVGEGKYVLLDFWASWCVPCMREMPNVINCYERYRNKGFEVVGVSLDQNKPVWEAAVKRIGTTWPQMSDLKGWRSTAVQAYGICNIPGNVLIDPMGKIVATDLKGKALAKKLAEIYE